MHIVHGPRQGRGWHTISLRGFQLDRQCQHLCLYQSQVEAQDRSEIEDDRNMSESVGSMLAPGNCQPSNKAWTIMDMNHHGHET